MTTKSRIVKFIPKSEDGPRTNCYTTSKKEYIISWNRTKRTFTLWKKVKEGYEKLKTSCSPFELEEIIPWDE